MDHNCIVPSRARHAELTALDALGDDSGQTPGSQRLRGHFPRQPAVVKFFRLLGPPDSIDPDLFNPCVAVQFDSRAENDPMTDKTAGEFAGWVVPKLFAAQTKSTYEITSGLREKAS